MLFHSSWRRTPHPLRMRFVALLPGRMHGSAVGPVGQPSPGLVLFFWMVPSLQLRET